MNTLSSVMFELGADRTYTRTWYSSDLDATPSGIQSGRWWFKNGTLTLDQEPSPIRRSLRPILLRAGMSVQAIAYIQQAEITPDKMIFSGNVVYIREKSD
jgi:hypothetical protein